MLKHKTPRRVNAGVGTFSLTRRERSQGVFFRFRFLALSAVRISKSSVAFGTNTRAWVPVGWRQVPKCRSKPVQSVSDPATYEHGAIRQRVGHPRFANVVFELADHDSARILEELPEATLGLLDVGHEIADFSTETTLSARRTSKPRSPW